MIKETIPGDGIYDIAIVYHKCIRKVLILVTKTAVIAFTINMCAYFLDSSDVLKKPVNIGGCEHVFCL